MQRPTPSAPRTLDSIAVGGLLLCCMIWGVNQVALKVANDGLAPIFQAGLRSVLSGLLVLGWALWRGERITVRDGTLWPGIAVAIAFAANFMLIGPGLVLTEASRGVLFLYTAPFFVAVGSHFLVAGDRLDIWRLLGLVLAMGGLAVSVSDRLLAGDGRASLLGDMMCLGAGLSWGLSTLIVRTTSLRRVSPAMVLLYQLGLSAPLLFAASLAMGETPIGDFNWVTGGAFAYTVVVVVFASYVLWFWLLQTYPASKVSAFTFLAPIFTVLAGHVLLDEPVTWRHWAALGLIVAGLVLVNRPARNT